VSAHRVVCLKKKNKKDNQLLTAVALT
jgi:hypothetical protein